MSTLTAPGVLVVGDLMNDIVVRPEGLLSPGGDRAATIRPRPGGSGANQAAWLAAEGVGVRFAARAGAADVVHHARLLEEAGVEPNLAVDAALPTGTIVSVSVAGERSFFTDRGANDALCRDDLPPSLLDGVAHLHISGYSLFADGPREAALALMAEGRRRGIPVSVDPASWTRLEEVGAAAFLEWTRGAAMLFPNAAEAEILTRRTEPDGQLRVLLQHYPLVVLKRGGEPAVAASAGGERVEADPPRVGIVDASGAGDAFLAGFLAAHLRGESLRACLEAAMVRGAEAVSIVGARPLLNLLP